MSTRSQQRNARHPAALDAVEHERRHLMSLAYRLLGSLTEAEDAVQETYTRWYAMSPEQQGAIESPGAWLTTVATRVCLDQLRSARVRRERYVGEWIPEPLPDPAPWATASSMGDQVGSSTTPADPADRVTLDESLSMAFLVVLDSMTPAERVVFVLHDVFRYPFDEIAEMVGRSPAACRQLASSARRRVRAAGMPAAAPTRPAAEIVGEFKRAWEAADIDGLIGLLDPDAVATADGGGRVAAALAPVEGAEPLARYFVELAGLMTDGMAIVPRTVNGQPGLVIEQDGVTVSVVAFELVGERITRIWAIRNPDKLGPWTRGPRRGRKALMRTPS